MYFIFHPISSLNHLVARLVTDQITFFLSIVFFIVLALNYKNRFFYALDEAIYSWVKTCEKGFFKTRAEGFAHFGNAVFHIVFSVILSVVLFIAKHKLSVVLAILFVVVFSWSFNRLLKLIYKRIRPEHINSTVRKRLSYCFPSGHVMASIPIYFFSAVLLQGVLPFLPWYLIALFISISIIMSRIHLGHHYFTDILGGIFMGIFCLNISIWVYFFIGLV